MIELWEIMSRATSGTLMDEHQFNMNVAHTIKNLIYEFGIHFDKNYIIKIDFDMADRLFSAGLELATRLGLYCTSTHRLIKFTKDEIISNMDKSEKDINLGDGKDKVILKPNKIDRFEKIVIFGGAPGISTPEDLYIPLIKSYIKEGSINVFIPPDFYTIYGQHVAPKSPLEIESSILKLRTSREVMSELGRPDMPIVLANAAGTLYGDFGILSYPEFIKNDIFIITIFGDLKVDYDNLGKIALLHEKSIDVMTFYEPVIGGFAGRPEGVAVATVAGFLLSNVAFGAHVHKVHPVHYRYLSTTHPDSLRVMNYVGQAIANNTSFIMTGNVSTVSGTGTETILYEVAANTIVATINAQHPYGVCPTNGNFPHASGLEARFMAEIAYSILNSDITWADASNIVKELLLLYNDVFDKGSKGYSFDKVYDRYKIEPTKPWIRKYKKVKQKISELGLEILPLNAPQIPSERNI